MNVHRIANVQKSCEGKLWVLSFFIDDYFSVDQFWDEVGPGIQEERRFRLPPLKQFRVVANLKVYVDIKLKESISKKKIFCALRMTGFLNDQITQDSESSLHVTI